MRIGVVFFYFTRPAKIIDRVLEFFDLSIADASVYECLELITQFEELQGVGKLLDRLDCRRVLHFSIDET